jgi:hypothetical protein
LEVGVGNRKEPESRPLRRSRDRLEDAQLAGADDRLCPVVDVQFL